RPRSETLLSSVTRLMSLRGTSTGSLLAHQCATSWLYHHSALDNDAYPRLMCCRPQPIAPAPPMISMGLEALLELLAATTIPIASVVAPIVLTSDPRKLLVANALA